MLSLNGVKGFLISWAILLTASCHVLNLSAIMMGLTSSYISILPSLTSSFSTLISELKGRFSKLFILLPVRSSFMLNISLNALFTLTILSEPSVYTIPTGSESISLSRISLSLLRSSYIVLRLSLIFLKERERCSISSPVV